MRNSKNNIKMENSWLLCKEQQDKDNNFKYQKYKVIEGSEKYKNKSVYVDKAEFYPTIVLNGEMFTLLKEFQVILTKKED